VKRRAFIGMLLSTAAWPMAARAQQETVPVVGFLNSASPDAFAALVRRFREGDWPRLVMGPDWHSTR